MNTAENFIHSFNSDNTASIITRFFDEIMILYRVIGRRQDIDICTNDNASLATFTLLMDSEDDAKSLYSSLNNNTFSVYDQIYSIYMELSGENVITRIVKTPSV